MSCKFRKSEKQWKNDVLNSHLRDYSFKSSSGEEMELLYYPEDENFGINLTNRGGSMNNASFKIKDLKNPLNKPCFYPSYDFFIDYNGDVLMCSHDWNKENILGDMNHQSFNEIWTSEKAQESRKNLYNNKRNFSPCNVCDAEGSKVGKNHIIAWKNINPQ